jgi:hypothetical protein
MKQSNHTPEPWIVFKNWIGETHVTTGKATAIAIMGDFRPNKRENADRIVTCVNAMQGIEDPAKLRQTWEAVKHLELDAYHNCKAERDQLLEVLKEIIDHTTIDFAERNGFGPQRLKASEVYDRIQWGKANANISDIQIQ